MSTKYRWSCSDCALLDKSRKKWDENHYCYLYGCKGRGENGFVVGWCVHDRKDRELREMACSYFKPKQTEQAPKPPKKQTTTPTQPIYVQLTIFDLI